MTTTASGPNATQANRRHVISLLTIVVLLALVSTSAYLAVWYSHWSLMTVEHSDVYIFRGGGQLVLHGEPLYDHKFWAGYWTYPPFGALVMTPLALIPLSWLFPLWTALSLAALCTVVALSFPDLMGRVSSGIDRRVVTAGLTVVAVALTPVSDALGMGQLGTILTAMCLFDVVVLARRQSRWYGLLIGLATAVKLTPGLFIVYFVLRRQWKAAFVSSLTVAVCWAVSALIHWQDSKKYFGDWIIFKTNDQIGGDGLLWTNQSIYGAAHRLSGGGTATLLYVVASAATLVVGLGFAWHFGQRNRLLAAASLVGLTSVLISPISWNHHAIWVVPALGVIVGSGRSRRRSVLALGLVICLTVPPAYTQPLTGTSEWFVLLYYVLGASVITITKNTLRESEGFASRPPLKAETAAHQLNSTPERYFREAYDPVMYSGAIGVYSRIVHELMERRLRERHAPVILELGASSGQHSRYVRSTYDVYYETDIAIDEGITPQVDTPRTGLVRRYANAESLHDFEDGSVDRVIATCLLAHLSKPEEALREWRRVIRPGGMVTIYVAAEPGMLLRLLRRYFVVPKARRLGQDHLAIIYRDHRNHYPAMRIMIESVFCHDQISRLGFPVGLFGWNMRLFDIYYISKGGVADNALINGESATVAVAH